MSGAQSPPRQECAELLAEMADELARGRTSTLMLQRRVTRNSELLSELERYAHQDAVAPGVLSALGADPASPLQAESFPVLDFFFNPMPRLLSVYLLTPGRFILFEKASSGEELTIACSVDQLRRVRESADAETLTLMVELAGAVGASSESEEITAPEAERGEQGFRVGQVSTRTEYGLTRYTLDVARADAEGERALRRFGRNLRGALGI